MGKINHGYVRARKERTINQLFRMFIVDNSFTHQYSLQKG